MIFRSSNYSSTQCSSAFSRVADLSQTSQQQALDNRNTKTAKATVDTVINTRSTHLTPWIAIFKWKISDLSDPYPLTCMREDRVLLFMYCGTLVLYPTGVFMVVNVTWVFSVIQKLYLQGDGFVATSRISYCWQNRLIENMRKNGGMKYSF